MIVDEFGKGTESSGLHCLPYSRALNLTDGIDGAGLACGLFEYLLGLGDNRPKVVAATHFHEIFENGFLPPSQELQFGHMEVQINNSVLEGDDQITYLYKWVPRLYQMGQKLTGHITFQ